MASGEDTVDGEGGARREPLRTWIEDVERLAASAGLQVGLDGLREHADADQRATVVVAGEIKQGKSSLLNALIGERELLPIGADVRTGTRLCVLGGPEVSAEVIIEDEDDVRTLPISPAEIAQYAAVGAEPAMADSRTVAGVTVACPAPLFVDGLVAFDTPGLRGTVDAAHDQITVATLHAADALVYVRRADGPLKQTDLDFVGQAAERVETIIVALTCVDESSDWLAVAAENRQLLARAVPRLANAPIVELSALYHFEALELAAAGESAAAEVRLRAGNVGGLENTLRTQVLDRIGEIRNWNVRRALCGVVAQVEASLEPRLGAHKPSDLEAEEERISRQLQALAEGEKAAKNTMTDSFNDLRESVSGDVRTLLESLRAEATGQLAAAAPDEVDRIVPFVESRLDAGFADLQAAWQTRALQIAADGFEQLSERIDELPEPDRAGLALIRRVPRPDEIPPLDVIEGTRADEVFQALWPGVSIGLLGQLLVGKAAVSIGLVGASTSIASAVFWPVGLGLGVSLYVHRARKNRQETIRARQEGRRWLDTVLNAARDEANRAGGKQVDAAFAGARSAFVQRVAQQREALEATAAALDAQHSASVAERAADRAAAERLAEIATGLKANIGCDDVG